MQGQSSAEMVGYVAQGETANSASCPSDASSSAGRRRELNAYGVSASCDSCVRTISRHIPRQGMEIDGLRRLRLPSHPEIRVLLTRTCETFRSEDMETRMAGKNSVATGANSGIGYATAEGLAARGANVYMVCHNKEKGEAAPSEIQSATGNANIHLEICDLSSVNDVKLFASRFSSKDLPVHVLVNNAGLLENNRVTTSEGYELNFAVNVLGTFSSTELMLPSLEKAAPDARVIAVSSAGMYSTPLSTDLQVALTEKWAEIQNGNGVGFYSMHPGWAETPGVAKSLPDFANTFSGKLRTKEEAADTVISLALQPKENLLSGAFYFDRVEAPKHLLLAATRASHVHMDSIVGNLRLMCGLV